MNESNIVNDSYKLWFECACKGVTNPIQIIEMKKSFYCGFFSCFQTVRDASEHPDEKAFEILSSMKKELDDYFNKTMIEDHEKLRGSEWKKQ